MEIIAKRKTYCGKWLLILVALIVLAGHQPALAENQCSAGDVVELLE